MRQSCDAAQKIDNKFAIHYHAPKMSYSFIKYEKVIINYEPSTMAHNELAVYL